MNSLEQLPFSAAEFADNPEPRCPCLLVLDKSSSMAGDKIAALNTALQDFRYALLADNLAAKRVELAVTGFGPLTLYADFTTLDAFIPPTIIADGDTPIGAAALDAIERVRLRKELYKINGIPYYRPWIFLITDGEPTDDWEAAADEIRAGEDAKHFMFFAVGVEGANFDVLRDLTVRAPLQLKGTRFGDMFTWLSNSLSSVSRSRPGDQIALVNPTAPDGWAVAG
ncbi:MAG: VWA domain-containing protein [Alphaproteobacteria bacterium]|nr:VWA domain-containing protein [Alphaproteobacteria bacterium]